MNTKPKKSPTTKPTAASEPAPDPKKARAQRVSKLYADGVLPLAQIAEMFSRGLGGENDTDMMATYERMLEVGEAVNGGSLATAERLLFAQAATLNVLFAELTRRAALNMGQHLDATETYLRLALKAQAHSRATVQTLAEVKQPRAVAFVKQANIAQQQQVNNGAPVSHARTEESPKPANEQSRLEAPNEWSTLDTGATAAPARGNPEVETVGAIHRAEDTRGQGRVVG